MSSSRAAPPPPIELVTVIELGSDQGMSNRSHIPSYLGKDTVVKPAEAGNKPCHGWHLIFPGAALYPGANPRLYPGDRGAVWHLSTTTAQEWIGTNRLPLHLIRIMPQFISYNCLLQITNSKKKKLLKTLLQKNENKPQTLSFLQPTLKPIQCPLSRRKKCAGH